MNRLEYWQIRLDDAKELVKAAEDKVNNAIKSGNTDLVECELRYLGWTRNVELCAIVDFVRNGGQINK